MLQWSMLLPEGSRTPCCSVLPQNIEPALQWPVCRAPQPTAAIMFMSCAKKEGG